MKKETTNIDLLISKILLGEVTPDEILSFNQWLNEDEKNKKEFLILKEYFDVNIIEDKVREEIAFEKCTGRLNLGQYKRNNVYYKLFSLAASIAILILIGVAAYYHNKVGKESTEYYTHISNSGTSRVVLDDNTTVYLNENSRLTYSSEFGKKNRCVQLEGEAYFDVSHNNGLFVVDLGDAKIEVMGTKFNVRSFSDSSHIITTLEEGAICFKNNKQKIILHPNDQLIYNKDDESMDVSVVETAYATAWKDHVYKYAGISLEELCKELEKIYHVRIIVNSNYRNTLISGSFEYKMNINQVLNIIRKSLPFDYKINENKIIIN